MIKKLLAKKNYFLFFSVLTFLLISLLFRNNLVSQNKLPETIQNSPQPAEQTANNDVLGRNYQAPQIYLYGSNNEYSSGGMIPLASTDEPAVYIGGYNISGTIQIQVYEANEDALLDYLVHDKEGKQTKKNPDLNKFKYLITIKKETGANTSAEKVTLPLKETGIWFLRITAGKTTADAYVIRSNIGILTKEGDNEFIFWGQNFKTKRSVSDGVIKLFDLENSKKELQTVSFTAEGIARANLTSAADVALVQQNNDRAVIPINLKYLNTYDSYKTFQQKTRLTRYFIFTDRPLYKPGDAVNFKAILRDDDDARYTIPTGEALVRIYEDYYYEGSDKLPIFEKRLPISADGSISGEYQMSADTKVGYYTLAVSIPNQVVDTQWNPEKPASTASFEVQFFRKPEFSIDVEAPKTELIASDKTSFKIKGTYFSGQPLMNQKVKYTVSGADFYEYQYLTDQQNYSQSISNDYRYGSWYGDNKVLEGTAILNKQGEAEIDLDTKMSFNQGKAQIFSIEATLDDGSQTPSFARRNILVHAGDYGIYRKDYSYGSKVNTPVSIPIKLVGNRNNVNVGNINLNAKLHRENWITFQEEGKKYPSYKKEEEDLPQVTAKTDQEGNATITFTPTKIGSYKITVEGKDKKGNLISKIFYSYVSSQDQPYYTSEGSNELTIALDKQKYQPGDTALLNIFSSIPDRDVFLSLDRARVNRYQIIHLNGKNATVEAKILDTDMPNIYAEVSSFSTYTLDSTVTNIPVSTDSKKLLVNITPNSKSFGPGETATVNITTTDIGGNPVSAEVALWAVDKAIFEISENKLGDIFGTFWDERGNTTKNAHSLEGIVILQGGRGGGCFAEGTKVLLPAGKVKNIEEVKVGDYILTRDEKDSKLVKAKVEATHSTEVNGYLILNQHLKVTANHIIRVGDSWKEAGSIQIGDTLINDQGKPVKVESIEWQRGKFTVYNLTVEKYQTFFAGGVWVHNQKGPERQAFKDTAYWNPSIHTDASGRAQVSFKLPDNLTTWTLAAVGNTSDTKVGQITNEIVVTKDIIVRPIIPNILRVEDEVILSALVQNFTENDQIINTELKFDSGTVEQASKNNLKIKSNETLQLYWKVKPTKENNKSKLIFSAKAKDNKDLADIITQEIPVWAFGFEERKAEAGEGPRAYNVTLSPDNKKEKSKVTLSLSPTIVGTLPTAMKYLISYPYGCVEQTTSRFVPAVIAKLNPSLFAEALEDKDIDGVIEKGLARLDELQKGDGGWTWWYEGKSDPYITAYVVEYLLQAQKAGIKVNKDLLEGAVNYLEEEKTYDPISKKDKEYTRNEKIAKTYALTLLGKKDKVKRLTDFENISPDFLSLAVMSNYLNGDKDPQTNGLTKLISMVQTQGDAVFWNAGGKINFGSQDASTALAIRAILLAEGDRDLAAKGARYLLRNRKYDYWSNTYATAQIIRAIVELAKTGNELSPDYSYTVLLDGKQIAQGFVSSSKQIVKDINIPLSNINPTGSTISITKKGAGQIYSTLVISQFHTDRNAKALDKGLSVKREYVNEKGNQYSLAVGDIVSVNLTVGGFLWSEYYGVIQDELPAGMIPINSSFNNEQYSYDPTSYLTSYNVTDREITQNGMILSLYQLAPISRTYSYKARVISEGTFIVPPATASLMYAPEISGRSDVQIVKINKESTIVPVKAPKDKVIKIPDQVAWAILAILVLLAALAVIFRKKIFKRPPTPKYY